jgi:hypothetical protein
MFDYNMIVLGRLEHAEAVEGNRAPSVPLSNKPSFVRRLLTALRGVRREQVPHPDVEGATHQTHAGVVAK